MKIDINRRLSGYITVEASFIIPWIFMIFMLVIYFTFHLYNYCVVYQDCYIAALRGSEIFNADTGYVKDYVQKQADTLLDNQLYEYAKDAKVEVSAIKIEVDAKSEININQGKLLLYKNRCLDIERAAEAYRLNPVYLIRMARR